MKTRLNRSGLIKMLPFLEDLSSAYVQYGGVPIHIGYDGLLRLGPDEPTYLVSEAAGHGVDLVYLGIDRYGERCYDVLVPISEQHEVDIDPGSERTPVDVGRAAQEQQAAEQQKALAASLRAELAREMHKKLEKMFKDFAEKFEQAVENVGDAT